jgi:TIR domain-containing protein
MAGHFFISYSRQDGTDFALRLTDELEAGPPDYRVWLDQREMRRSRQDWDDQLTEAIQTCEGLVFVMTEDAVRVGSGCKDEWVWALKYKKPVIPIRVDPVADLPFRLGSRQFVDFSTTFTKGLAELRRDLRWLSTPEGQLRELEVRLAEAERELPRVDPSQQPRIEREIEQLQGQIAAQRRLVVDPTAAAEQTDTRIEVALERERQPERPDAAPPRARFVNPPPMTAPAYFQDRYVETSLVGDFLRDGGLRAMWVVGRGGVGKTAMVCRLLMALEHGRLPDDLGELAVDGIVYLSRHSAHPVDFAHVFADLCRLLPSDVADALLARSRDPHETPAALIRALVERFPAGTWVLLLDNFEDVVDADGVGLIDAGLDEALRTLLLAPRHGVKVIITTRVAPQSLVLVQPGTQRHLNLEEGLPSPFAEEVLRAMDADGSLGIRDAPAALLGQARERTRGFPRALEALAAILAADRDTTLDELLAATARMPDNVVEALVGEAFNLLDATAQHVMQALAVYPGPVPPVAVDYLLQPFEPSVDSAPVLSRLVNMQFVRRDAGRYYLHQVDSDYALQRVPEGEPGDRYIVPQPFSRYALRERAADYFVETRTPRETWRTLDDLAPQLAEFDLRCQAGDYDTAAGSWSRSAPTTCSSGATTAWRETCTIGFATASPIRGPTPATCFFWAAPATRWVRCGARRSSSPSRGTSTRRSGAGSASPTPRSASGTAVPRWASCARQSTSSSRRSTSITSSATGPALPTP